MIIARRQRFALTTVLLVACCNGLIFGEDDGSASTRVDPFPETYGDPAVPLLLLPTQFRARRTSASISAEAGQPVEVLNVKGAGCVRHVWFVFGRKNLDDVEIEITVDGADEPQVRMPFRSFFGALLGFEDYHINSAGVVNFPNFTVTNDPLIPPKASPGWNFYLPIPFSSSCRIMLHGKSAKHGAAMVDWQQYQEGVEPTPLRFHAQRNVALPASPSKPFPITETQGTGFLAGYIMGWRQQDHADMVFHNSGTRMLIDGQTDPHVICGHNVEDDFGFSWGFNQYQTRWAGCPYRDNRGRTDQDGVFYRFFGPDPILFRSSFLFTSNARPDDYEAVSYFYKVPASQAPQVRSPSEWAAIGPFGDGNNLDTFRQPAGDIVQQLSRAELPETLRVGTADFAVHHLKSKYGWLRLEHVVQYRPAYPLTDHSFYVRATLHSDAACQATLRLALDDWAVVWLNGKQVTLLDHAGGFETARLPISLQKGDNHLVIKTNNRQNSERHLWAINCVVEEPDADVYSRGIKVQRDIAYVQDGHPRQSLDLYLPTQPDEPRPLVVWIHGGAWRQGNKDDCPAVPLVNRGFAVASINYRLSSHATFPAQVHDCKAAIRWLRANSRTYNIDPEKIGVWGASAGGHLAALLGTSGDVDSVEGNLGNADVSSRVQAVCDWFGPTDLLRMNQQAGEFGTIDHDAPGSPESMLLGSALQDVPEKARVASPLTYVTADDPAFLIVHGDQDRLVPWQQSELLNEALTAAGRDSELTMIVGAGHGQFDRIVTEDCFRFFERILLPAPTAQDGD